MSCNTQNEFDAAIKAGGCIEIEGDGDFIVREGEPCIHVRAGQPRVVARESSQPRVVAWGSSQPRVVARESSQPRVEARESSQPRVVAWGSSQPRVEARESSQPRVEARESSQAQVDARGNAMLSVAGNVIAEAGPDVSVLIDDADPKVNGGLQRRAAARNSAKAWCDYYGVRIVDGFAWLYKGVRADLRSKHGLLYPVGRMVEAPDWDGGETECGGGLHFSPHPKMTREFDDEATRFLICPVALEDIRAPKPGDTYPQKVKARAVTGPIIECDEDGVPLAATAPVAEAAR